jgi:hypothetical protein
LGFRTIVPSDYRAFGLLGLRTIGPSDCWADTVYMIIFLDNYLCKLIWLAMTFHCHWYMHDRFTLFPQILAFVFEPLIKWNKPSKMGDVMIYTGQRAVLAIFYVFYPIFVRSRRETFVSPHYYLALPITIYLRN